ncbi:MAG: bifunctional riboflavin kinase/FAD synthetase [Planctomycetota bacterium]
MTQLIRLSQWDADAELRSQYTGGCISIGNFDGVHVGHRDLLAQTRLAANRIDGSAIAVVLDPHPAAVLRPHNAPPKLTTIERRAELMASMQIDALLVCPATMPFLNLSADDFFYQLIVDRLAARAMVEGPNFFFGRDRGGDVRRLESLCDDAGVQLTVVEPTVDPPTSGNANESGTRMISSSRIREAIAVGDVSGASEMLQSRYQIAGTVGRGEERGRTIGFPTANLHGIDVLIPGHGVYAAIVTIDGKSDSSSLPHAAAVHLGPNPTFDDQNVTKVEVHIIDYDADLYGRRLRVDFIRKIRDVKRFESPEALVRQLNHDIEQVRQCQP